MRNAAKYSYVAFLIMCISAGFTAAADEETNNPAELNPDESSLRPDYYPWTFGIEGGSQGLIGGLGRWRFSDHVGMRVAGDWTKGSFNNVGIKGTDYNVQARLLAEPLTLDVYPWKKHSWYVSLGWTFNQNQLTGSATPHPTINIGGQSFPIEQVGTLDLKVQQQPVNPYLSIGGNFFYFDRAHHWAFGGELGVAYTGDPKVDLTRSGQPSPIIDQAVAVAAKRTGDWAKQYQWWPMAKLSVTFSF